MINMFLSFVLFIFPFLHRYFLVYNYKSKTLCCCFDVVLIYIDYMPDASLLLAYHKVANSIEYSAVKSQTRMQAQQYTV